MMSGFGSRAILLANLFLLVAAGRAQEPAKAAPDHPTSPNVSSALSDLAKQKQKKDLGNSKLDPPLAAVLRGWRRNGIAGAEQESASRNIKMDRLRLASIIYLVDETRSGEVVAALRHAWGETSSVQDNRIYALIPVPALRRISAMHQVKSINLDRPMQSDSDISKEKHR